MSRGWIFQDWISSRRVIRHTGTVCFYQCQKFGPRSTAYDGVNLETLENGDANLSVNALFGLESSTSEESIFDKWRFAVHISLLFSAVAYEGC